MKRILRYSRHLLRARGRHGTHSPFVYAFVEQVMRRKARTPLLSQQFFSGKELDLLYKTIGYLDPQRICAPQEWMGTLSLITDPAAVQLEPLPLAGPVSLMPGELLLVPSHKSSVSLLSRLLLSGQVQVLVFGPHKSKEASEVWKALCALQGVDLSLDYWYWGLLLKDPVFKARQHFRIR